MALSTALLLSAPLTKSLASVLEKPGYDDNNLGWVKLVVAGIGLLALAYEAVRDLEGRPIAPRSKRFAGGVLAVLGALCYFQFFQIGYREFYHRWEFFHYYLGAKYARELGYEGLYACAAVAEEDLGFSKEVRARKLRDLRSNAITTTTDTLDHPALCKDRFTPPRWDDFKKDVSVFREVSYTGNGAWWGDMQKDHGYNPTPVWTITGKLFAELHPAAVWYMKLLSCIDIALFAALFGMIAWAFGWRTMCLAMFFWGTAGASPFYWTGGAFLRQDWLFYTIGSACLVRKRKYAWGGAFLTYGALLRVFPVLFFGGWVVTAAAHFWKTRAAALPRDMPPGGPARARAWLTWRFGRTHVSLAAGAIAAALVLVPTSMAVAGPRAWPAFLHQMQIHTAMSSTNRMGWKVVVSQRGSGRMEATRDNRLADPFQRWKEARRDNFQRALPVYALGVLLAVGAFVWACWRLKNPWVVEALGCILPTTTLEVASYYYSYFLFAPLLARGRRTVEFAVVIAALLSELCAVRYGQFDDRFTAMSLVFVELAFFLVVVYSRRAVPRAEVVATRAVGAVARAPRAGP